MHATARDTLDDPWDSLLVCLLVAACTFCNACLNYIMTCKVIEPVQTCMAAQRLYRLYHASMPRLQFLPHRLHHNRQRMVKGHPTNAGPKRHVMHVLSCCRTYKNEGLSYSVGGLTGNTLDSHRLIEWAGRFGADKQNALVEELFANYFCQEKFINDQGVLVAAAEKAGLHGAAEYLADPQAGRQEVLERVARAQGVGGVPHFTINKKCVLVCSTVGCG